LSRNADAAVPGHGKAFDFDAVDSNRSAIAAEAAEYSNAADSNNFSIAGNIDLQLSIGYFVGSLANASSHQPE